MSFFFGGGSKAKPSYTGLQLQTSSSAQGIVIAWGANRFAPNLIDYDDFKAHKQKKKAGKGVPKQTTYTYTATVILGLCEGEITGIGKTWKDKEQIDDIASINLTLFTGSDSQMPWGYMTTAHPTKALAYRQTAYLAGANYDLSESATLLNHTFEVFSRQYNSASWCAGGEADVAVIIDEFLTLPQFGMGFSGDLLDESSLMSGPDATTTGDTAFQTYCRAMGFGLSPMLSAQETARDILQRWMNITNSEIVWTGYSAKFVPYCYTEITANGVTFLGSNTPVYTIGDDDVVAGGEDPITVDRTDPSEASNSFKLTINDREFAYNEKPIPWIDQSLIERYKERAPVAIKAPEVTDRNMAAVMIALYGSRIAYDRNTYKFKLGPEYVLVEPMDILQVNDPALGDVLVQIKNVTENDDGDFEIEAKQLVEQTASNPGFEVQPPEGDDQNTGVLASPVNPPLIFEPPADLTKGTAQVWAAVSGGDGTTRDPNWGGCVVYVSTNALDYQDIGTIDTPARMGKTTAALPAYPGVNPDTVNTLAVDINMSGGEFISVDPVDAELGATLCLVGTEFLSYTTATLTDPFEYDLDDLYRGLFRSAPALQALGSDFARLDENIFKFDLPPEYVGIPLTFKFQSFNIWGNGFQDLADCVEYNFTPAGIGFEIDPPGSVGLAFSSVLQTDGTTIITGTIAITASAGPYLDHYDTQVTLDAGVNWLNVPSISAAGTQTSFAPAVASTNYQARVRAVSSTFDGIPSAWVTSAVVNSGALGGTPPDQPDNLVGTPGILSNLLTWDPAGTGAPQLGYRIYAIHGASGSFGSAGLIGTSPSPFFTHAGLGVADTWRYWVVAYNAAGESPEEGPQNVTTSSTGGGALDVEDEGSLIVTNPTALNFVGAGVTVVESPSGVAEITIPGGGGGGGGGGGALVFLEEQVASASATLDFTASISSLYDEYVIEFIGLIPSAGTPGLLMRVSTDGGATYETTSYSWAQVIYGLSTNFGQYTQGTTTGLLITNGSNTNASYGLNGTTKLFDPAGSVRYKYINTEFMMLYGSDTYRGFSGSIWSNAAAVDAFQFLFASGDIASGVVRCYGVAKVASSGGGGSIQDVLDMAVAAVSIPSYTVGSAVDVAVTQGDMAALAFYAYCPGTGAVQTSVSQITVPVGKTAVLVRVEQNTQSQVNPSFYAARLWNVTTAAQVFNTAYGAEAIPAGYAGVLQPDTANSSISFPKVVGAAGDVLEAHHWTANDGNTRTVTAQYIIAFI